MSGLEIIPDLLKVDMNRIRIDCTGQRDTLATLGNLMFMCGLNGINPLELVIVDQAGKLTADQTVGLTVIQRPDNGWYTDVFCAQEDKIFIILDRANIVPEFVRNRCYNIHADG
jgi:predicted DCC family thiol-disulfide oxidoreductase YuxK